MDDPNATVLTYGTRKSGSFGPFAFKSVVLGRWGIDRQIMRSWVMDWPDEQAAVTGHARLCDDLAKHGPDTHLGPGRVLQ
jgi:hypothetical protein